ncbi:MAG: hypothetical protein V3S04_00845, partial [Candidatus Omnitrophota bacterium]
MKVVKYHGKRRFLTGPAVAFILLIGFSGRVFAETQQDIAAGRVLLALQNLGEKEEEFGEKLDSIESSLAELKARLSGIIGREALQGKVALLNTHFNQLLSENKSYQDKITAANSTISAFKESITAFSNRRRSLEVAKQDLEALLSSKEEELNKLKEDYASSTKEVVLLREEAGRATWFQEDLKTDIKKPDAQTEGLTERLAQLEKTTKLISADKQELATFLEQKEEKLAKLKGILRRLYQRTCATEGKDRS